MNHVVSSPRLGLQLLHGVKSVISDKHHSLLEVEECTCHCNTEHLTQADLEAFWRWFTWSCEELISRLRPINMLLKVSFGIRSTGSSPVQASTAAIHLSCSPLWPILTTLRVSIFYGIYSKRFWAFNVWECVVRERIAISYLRTSFSWIGWIDCPFWPRRLYGSWQQII